MSLRTSDFEFELPGDLIAQEPSATRGHSRLLVVAEALRDATFVDLVDLVPPGDLLVLNTTRVRHARFLGARASGAPAEVLLLHPASSGNWIAIGKPGSALRPGKRIAIGPEAFIETVAVLDEGYREVRFIGITAEAAMRSTGRLPLPPYIERDPTDADEQRYQTVYAREPGSVAAPTAGLHFDDELLAAVRGAGAELAYVTLHVGAGTFQPVRSEDLSEHRMHRERYRVPPATAAAIARTREQGGRVFAVGTTALRALESAALGGFPEAGSGIANAGAWHETELFVTPGFRFQVVDALLTNFHLPRSTLLMLVSAFAGVEQIRAAYRHAVAAGYRFFSYGDAMLLQRREAA